MEEDPCVSQIVDLTMMCSEEGLWVRLCQGAVNLSYSSCSLPPPAKNGKTHFYE